MTALQKDPNPNKTNLALVSLKMNNGNTPFKTVKQAKSGLLAKKKPKFNLSYRGAQLIDPVANAFYLVNDPPHHYQAACSNSSHSWRQQAHYASQQNH